MFDDCSAKRDDDADNIAALAIEIDADGVASVSYGYDDDASRKALVRSLLTVAGDLALGDEGEIIH